VLAVAIALGAYLIDLGAGHHTPASAASTTTRTTSTTTTTSTTAPTTTSTTAPAGAHPSATVKVLVANASQTNGVAGYYTSKLSAAGWGTLTAVTATTSESTSTIYYATGQQQNALAVAATVGASSTAVQAIGATTHVPLTSTTNADIVVIVGDDLAAKVPASSS
jgi:LytR cell envelope-related transcriptional attenuator